MRNLHNSSFDPPTLVVAGRPDTGGRLARSKLIALIAHGERNGAPHSAPRSMSK